jgi:hypothetical protein
VTAPVTAVTYTTEDFVRRTVGRMLRGRYQGGVVCSTCLVGMTLERLHTGWRRSEIEHAMEKVFNAPGVLGGVSSGPCARCKRPNPCIGEHAS